MFAMITAWGELCGYRIERDPRNSHFGSINTIQLNCEGLISGTKLQSCQLVLSVTGHRKLSVSIRWPDSVMLDQMGFQYGPDAEVALWKTVVKPHILIGELGRGCGPDEVVSGSLRLAAIR